MIPRKKSRTQLITAAVLVLVSLNVLCLLLVLHALTVNPIPTKQSPQLSTPSVRDALPYKSPAPCSSLSIDSSSSSAPVKAVDQTLDVADIKQAEVVKQQWIMNETVTFVLQSDMNASFFFVEDNAAGGIDPIRSFVRAHEAHVRRLFNHLLYRPSCTSHAPQTADWGVGCAVAETSSTPAQAGARVPIVLDVGSNRGYYALLSAAYGHTVHAFDPQPHCASLLSAEVLLNGFSDRLHFHHAFVSDTQASNASAEAPLPAMQVRRRTGCTGTFPNDNENGWGDAFRRPLQALRGADDEVSVRGVRLDDLFSADKHDVLLMKVDVEGHEDVAMGSARALVSARAVRNIVMELNLPMMRRQERGYNETRLAMRRMVKWLMHDVGYRAKVNVRGAFERQSPMTDGEWDSLLGEDEGWNTLDAWFYLPN